MFWELLQNIGNFIQLPWLLIGDFNTMMFSHEWSSGSLVGSSRDNRFSQLVDDLGLVNLDFSGSAFTWLRETSEGTFVGAQLDRALYSMDWCLLFSRAFISHLSHIQSYHCSMLLSLVGSDNARGMAMQFCFQMAWQAHPLFNF